MEVLQAGQSSAVLLQLLHQYCGCSCLKAGGCLQEKEASLLRSLEAANLAALQATRQALPQLPHPLALRSLLSGVMSGASAVGGNLYDNVRSRGQRQQSSEVHLQALLAEIFASMRCVHSCSLCML